MGLEELENKLYENNNGEIAEVISLVRQCVGVLYETVLWVAQIGNAIPVRDQILLLYESWHELFLVGLFNKLRTTPIQQTLPGLQISGALEDQWYIITTVLNKLKGFKLDLVAMGRFKQLVFLRYDAHGMQYPCSVHIENLQTQAQMMLREHLLYDNLKFGKMLLTVGDLRDVEARSVRSIFFHHCPNFEGLLQAIITEVFRIHPVPLCRRYN
ncbi:hypothetical protein RvY_07593-1 [Ramazzottius varieornatus]|uniref:NR LBD domain-containing protein n=1 Tax=Ramazzottius varieornatus TaxID=947166 RepID=A0A1D1V7S1_RAMVA|nr:hypothetical protein RvY_07593-1 [Ramazzottius varieornatus]